jgi:hypothetical protein
MKKSKEFIDKNGVNLIIENKKGFIFLKTDNKNLNRYLVRVYFEEETFKEMIQYITEISKEMWGNFSPKEAEKFSEDYTEYYDKKYDNSGYLSLSDCCLRLETPSLEAEYVYKFNKKRVESFIFDCLNRNMK